MDVDSLYTNLRTVSENLLVCYRQLSYLDKKGLSNSLEYESCLKTIDSLTLMEDYYYNYLCSMDSEYYDKFIDMFFDSYYGIKLKIIIGGDWYLLFKDVDDDLLCGFRIFNNIVGLSSRKALGNSSLPSEVAKAFQYGENLKKQLFLDLVSDVCKSGECGSHKGEMYKALYDFAFIYKKNNTPEKPNIPVNIAANAGDIEILTKLCGKMISLTEKACMLPNNFRSISLNACYIKSLITFLPNIAIYGATSELFNGKDADHNKYGYKALTSLFESIDDLKEKYNDEDYTLKRKF